MAVTVFSGIVLAVGLAVFLRTFRIFGRGLIFWDDGERILETQYLVDLIRFIRNNARHDLFKKDSLAKASSSFRGTPPFDCNPMNILIYAGTALAGVSVEHSAIIANVVFGTLGIIGVYATAASMFDPQVAMISALLLAVSGQHLLYSRSVHAEVTCGAFYIWATYAFYSSYTTGSLALLAVTGLLVGLAFACNSRHVYIPVFFLIYAVTIVWHGSADAVVSRFLLLGAGMVLPLVVLVLVIHALKELGYPGPSYLRQLGSLVLGGRGSLSWKLPYLSIFLRSFWELEGIVLLGGLAGCGLLVAEGSLRAMIVVSQVLVPLLLWSARVAPRTSEGQVVAAFAHSMPRFMSSSIYALVIAAAVAVVRLPSFWAYLVVGIVLLMGLHRATWILKMRSGFKAAIAYMADHGGLGHMSFCPPISSVYAAAVNVGNPFPLNEKEFIEECRRIKFQYLLYVSAIHRNTFSSRRLNGVLERLLSSETPEFTVPLGMIPLRAVYWDEHNNPDSIVMRENRIEIYDLRKYLSAHDGPVSASIAVSA